MHKNTQKLACKMHECDKKRMERAFLYSFICTFAVK